MSIAILSERAYVTLVINSNLVSISHRFRDVAIFPRKKTLFSYPLPPFNPKFENISLALQLSLGRADRS